MRAMIFAAGLGTRLRPLTYTMPKAMVGVSGRPLLQHAIDRIRAAGVRDIVVNVHHFADQIMDYVAEDPHIWISDERDLLRDTGGAVRHAMHLLGQDDVLIHNVDILSNVDLCAFMRMPESVAARLLVSERATQRYLLFDDAMCLVGWTNVSTGEVRTPYESLDVGACRRLAFAGIHVVGRRLVEELSSWPERFSIIDFYLEHCRNYHIQGYIQPDLRLLDVGKADTLAAAERFLQEQMNNGA